MAKKRSAPRRTPPAGHVIHGDVGGDVVGGNKTQTTTAGGDIVHGDKIVTQTAPGASLEEAFRLIHARIEARPADPQVDKDEIEDTVARIEAEAGQGENARGDRLERLLLTLGGMADDIFQVVVATLTNPALGLAKTVQLIARKAAAERTRRDIGAGQP